MSAPSAVFRRPAAAPPPSSSNGRPGSSSGGAILVTAPTCARHETAEGVVTVEPERCEAVDDLSESRQSNHNTKNPLVRFFESNFGAEDNKSRRGTTTKGAAGMQEMEERKAAGGPTVKIVACRREDVGGFDICREYSYSGDNEDADGDVNDYFNDTKTTAVVTSLAMDGDDDDGGSVTLTHILGRTYHPIRDYGSRRDDESSLFWFTYRCDFPEIQPYQCTSDAGWGCMLRSAQMMLGQALRLHYRGRDWKPPHMPARRRQDPFVRSVLTWFADFPSATENIYSLHNMVATGLAKYDKLPGEWYEPGTASYVLRDLVEMHERHQKQQQEASGNTKADRRVFRVHVAPQSSVYLDSIEQLMTRDSKARIDEERKLKAKEHQPDHPLDLAWEEELVESADSNSVEWDTALLLLIPLRLGLKTFNQDYVEAVAHTFSLPQSVGVLGGRPRGARWFYGALSDGSKVFGLDPHTVQNAPRKRSAMVNRKSSSVVDLTDDYLRSVHTTYPEVFSLEKMDPSVALGFYCRDRADLDRVLASLRDWKAAHPKSPDLFTVSEAAPDYSANVSSAMDDMLMTGSLMADGDDGDQGSDEDEYVML